MDEVAKVIHLIKHTPGYNDKQYLLKKNADVPGLKEILRFIYDPYFKTGIAAAKLEKALISSFPYEKDKEVVVTYKDIIKFLKANNTGTDYALWRATLFINCTEALYPNSFATELAKAIVTQDLQIGVTAKTLNAVFGSGFIPTVGCMLGTKITDIKPHKIKWPCIVTEKLDGVRRILIKENGVSRFYSRSGHEDFGLHEILAEAVHLPDNRVYDGELLAIGDFKDSIALRQVTNSLANLKGPKTGLGFHIFDMLPLEEFYNGASEDTAFVRKAILGATFGDESISKLGIDNWPYYIASYSMHRTLDHIKAVPILGVVKNMSDIDPIVAEIWSNKGEGVMLNAFDNLYEVKRSRSLIKVKNVEEFELTVIGMLEGTGKYEDMLGALLVDYKGSKVGVGSGFTDAQRYEIWNNQAKYIGKKIDIESFGESTNQDGFVSLNCPIFKRFVGEVE